MTLLTDDWEISIYPASRDLRLWDWSIWRGCEQLAEGTFQDHTLARPARLNASGIAPLGGSAVEMAKTPKRPRDPDQLAKLIADIASGEAAA